MATDTHAKPPASRKRATPPKDKGEAAALVGDIELKNFLLQTVDKKVADIDVDEHIVAGEVTRSMDGSELSVTVHDFAREIVKSNLLTDSKKQLRAIDVNLDGMWFRLISWTKQGPDLSLKFEDRGAVYLREKRGPKKAASRAKVTRAQYILTLIRTVKVYKIPVDIYELKVKRTIAKPDEDERKRRAQAEKDAAAAAKKKKSKGGHGFDKGAEKRLGLTKQQLANMEVALDEAILSGANEKVMLAMMVAGFGESQWSKKAVDWKYHTHKGVFQSNQIPPEQLDVQAHHFLVGGRSFLAGGAIGYEKDHPNASVGEIAAHTEISDGSTGYYDSFISKGKKVLDDWKSGTGTAAVAGGGSSSADAATGFYYKRYEFRVDKSETIWEAIQRLANEVEWRAFFSGGKFYYYPESALFRQPSRMTVSEESEGILNIDFSQDYRKKASGATITARMDRWDAPPATTVVLTDMGSVNGKWLVESVTRNLFSAEATIQLKQWTKPRPEPRSQLMSRQAKQGSAAAKKRIGRSQNAYVKVDPGNGSFIAQTTRPDGKRVLPNQWLLDFLADLAGAAGTTIYTNTYTRHKQFSSSNLPSDHWVGNGCDVNITNAYRNYPSSSSKPTVQSYANMIAEEAFKLTGMVESQAHALATGGGLFLRYPWKNPHDKKTYSVQILWGPKVSHTDHVHIGVRP